MNRIQKIAPQGQPFDPVRAAMNWVPSRGARLYAGALLTAAFGGLVFRAFSAEVGAAILALIGAACYGLLLATLWRDAKQGDLLRLLVPALLVGLALGAHFSLFSISPGRMKSVLIPLSDTLWNYDLRIAMAWEEGSWSGGYLIVMALLSRLETFSLLYAVKLIDLVCLTAAAIAVHRLARLRGAGAGARAVALVGALLLPTMLLNAGLWAQCDAVFAAFSLWGLAMLLQEKPWRGMALWGIALAMKLQSAFLFPLLLFWFMRRKVGMRHLLALLAAFLLLHLPMLLEGQSLPSVLGRYEAQRVMVAYGAPSDEEEAQEEEPQEAMEETLAEGETDQAEAPEEQPTHEGLASHAPSVYSLMSIASVREFSGMGRYLGYATALLIVFAMIRSRRALDADAQLSAAMILCCALPLILPQANPRFLYLAGLLSLTRLRGALRILEAALLELVSFCSVLEAIFSTDALLASVLPMTVLSLLAILVACMVAWELFCACTDRDLWGNAHDVG